MSTRALAIETSGRIGSVALAENGNTLAEDTFPHGLQHAARIIPAIDALCKQLHWTAADLNEIYVSAGPGSFTGLRIGITLAKTLSLVTRATLVAVPSVRVLVENAPSDAINAIIVLDAKRDQIFTASFRRAADGWTELEPAHLGFLTTMLAKTPRPVHLVGEGIPYHRKFIPENDPQIHLTDDSQWRPQAKIVAILGWRMARANKFTDAMNLRPIYIRKPEAEEKLDGP
jgi:tRNA threonylcarbamoyladenosine biosynthesis protein TsaB